MTEIPEKIKIKARKLKALAEQGVGGEKTNARTMYEEYLAKHKIRDEDIDLNANNRTLYTKSQEEVDLLLNVVLSVNPYTRYSIDKFSIKCELDAEDIIEVNAKFEYFLKLWKVEKELLTVSFFNKHRQFFKPDDEAVKKWRDRNVENDSIKNHKEEMNEVNAEWKKMQRDIVTGKLNEETLTNDVIDSGDRIKTMAFNANRSIHMEAILLDAKYVKSKRKIN